MGIFDNLLHKLRKNDPVLDNRRIAAKLNDIHVKYISEKDAHGVDTIIGRECHVNLLGEDKKQMAATEGIRTLFRLTVDDMKIWEFMSLDGCVITFNDLDTGAERTVTVYYDKHLT